MCVSTLRLLVSMAQYMPLTILRHLFQVNASLVARPLLFARESLVKCQVLALYVMAGQTIVVYSCLVFQKVAPYVEAVALKRAQIQVVILCQICLQQAPYLSLVSSYIPRTLTLALDSCVIPSRYMLIIRLKVFCQCIKQISLYFKGAKCILCLFAYSKHLLCVCYRQEQLLQVIGHMLRCLCC